jgi:hypothetical protein
MPPPRRHSQLKRSSLAWTGFWQMMDLAEPRLLMVCALFDFVLGLLNLLYSLPFTPSNLISKKADDEGKIFALNSPFS